MPELWEKFVGDLKSEGIDLLKNEIGSLLGWAKKDSSQFIKEQGLELEKRLNQLAKGEITKSNMEMYAKDMEDLTRAEALKMSVKAKAKAERLADGINGLILSKLLALLLA